MGLVDEETGEPVVSPSPNPGLKAVEMNERLITKISRATQTLRIIASEALEAPRENIAGAIQGVADYLEQS